MLVQLDYQIPIVQSSKHFITSNAFKCTEFEAHDYMMTTRDNFEDKEFFTLEDEHEFRVLFFQQI